MDFITYLQQALMQQIPEALTSYAGDLAASSLSEMESGLNQMTHELSKAIMEQWLEAQEPK